MKKFQKFRSVANHLLHGVSDTGFASDILCRGLPSQEYWSDREGKDMPFFNVLLYQYPLDFVNNLANCDKTAYLDTNENIDSILPYINDVSGKLFVKQKPMDFLQRIMALH